MLHWSEQSPKIIDLYSTYTHYVKINHQKFKNLFQKIIVRRQISLSLLYGVEFIIVLIMSRYQHILQLFLKHTPEVNKARSIQQFHQANFSKMAQRQVDPLIRYIDSLQIHREYLEFFQIGVVRDQRSKIEKVAKYVGLAIREVNVFPFENAPIVQDQTKNEKKQ